MNRIATIISYLTHPLIIPILGLLIISNSGTYVADLDNRYLNFIYLSVFVFTLLIPAGLIPVFYYFGLTRNLHLSEKRERLIPLYITLLSYMAAYYFIRNLPVSFVYQRFLFAGCLSILFVLAISYWWKISAHMVGWGGLAGLIWSLSWHLNTDLMLMMIVTLLLTGSVGFARLQSNAHSHGQVYTGFIVGLLTVVIVFALR